MVRKKHPYKHSGDRPRATANESASAKKPHPLTPVLALSGGEQEQCLVCSQIIELCFNPKLRKIELGTYGELTTGSSCTEHSQLIEDALDTDTIQELPSSKVTLSCYLIGKKDTFGSFPWPNSPPFYKANLRVESEGALHSIPIIPSRMGETAEAKRQWIDLRLLNDLKSQCDGTHRCREAPAGTKPSWLIDVSHFCIVPFPPSAEYLALSYVWGDVQQLMTTKANLDSLRIPGALNATKAGHLLPRTILHAISLTDSLKERYLWVDALCIIQDDDDFKQSELRKMAGIYASASLTIVAANGTDSNSGLPGLQGISEHRCFTNLSSYNIGNKLTVYVDPFLSAKSSSATSTSAIWDSRAWTFQEKIFSRRKLIFHNGFVTWECTRARAEEFVFRTDEYEWDGTNNLWKDADPNPRRFLDSEIPDLGRIGFLLRSFNRRKLSYPEDALDAFAGIATSFSSKYIGSYISGLPSLFFNRALLWESPSEMDRRQPKKGAGKACLPSWSWSGWHGDFSVEAWDTLISSCLMSGYRVTSRLQWRHHQSRNDPGEAIDYRWSQCQKEYEDSPSGSLPDGWTQHASTDIVKHLHGSPLELSNAHPESINLAKFLKSARIRAPDRESSEKGDIDSLPRYLYTHASTPGMTYLFPLPICEREHVAKLIYAPLISCTTHKARFQAGENITGSPSEFATRHNNPVWVGGGNNIAIRNDDGVWVGGLNVQQATDPRTFRGTRLELIELAQGRFSIKEDGFDLDYPAFLEFRHPEFPKGVEIYEYYYVMWITWQNDIAYRAGLGRILKDAWEAADKEEINVMLG